MRLQGSPSQNSSSISSQGQTRSKPPFNLFLKEANTTQNHTYKIVEAIIVENNDPKSTSKERVSSVLNSQKYNLKKENEVQSFVEIDTESESPTSSNTSIDTNSSNTSKSNKDLEKKIDQLHDELIEMKNLINNNLFALNASKPMPSGYRSGTIPPNSNNQGTTLSQAEIHYLRYGSHNSNLNILA
jgi:hypothetical protein